jgi:hypothetical protein
LIFFFDAFVVLSLTPSDPNDPTVEELLCELLADEPTTYSSTTINASIATPSPSRDRNADPLGGSEDVKVKMRGSAFKRIEGTRDGEALTGFFLSCSLGFFVNVLFNYFSFLHFFSFIFSFHFF